MKKNEQIPGQISFCFNDEMYVVQRNNLIDGRQSLSLSAAKIVRAVIMQIKPNDMEFHTYLLPIGQLASLLGASRTTLSRDIDKITDELLDSRVEIKEYSLDNKEYKFLKIPWVSLCAYSSKGGLAIELNNKLAPLLLQLLESQKYTQYLLQDILQMKSVYAVRLYEMIMSRIVYKTIPREGVNVEISVNDIRTATDTLDKFERYSSFKAKVIEKAEAEILRTTTYKITHEEVKSGKKVIGFIFHVEMNY